MVWQADSFGGLINMLFKKNNYHFDLVWCFLSSTEQYGVCFSMKFVTKPVARAAIIVTNNKVLLYATDTYKITLFLNIKKSHQTQNIANREIIEFQLYY